MVVQLRQLKDDIGTSLDRLAARTGYSASSWERYLGGRLLPPREAVEALARTAGADPVRLLALHQAATEAWQSGQQQEEATPPANAPISPAEQPAPAPAAGTPAATTPAAGTANAGTLAANATDATNATNATNAAEEPPAEPGEAAETESPSEPVSRSGPVKQRGPSWRTVITSAIAALVGAAVALAVAQPWQGAPACAPSRPVAVIPPPPHYTCRFTQVDGRWYAGISKTSSDLLEVTMDGPEVAELQCLLQHAGISPGGIDGSFGPLTERAVIKEQQAKNHGRGRTGGPGNLGGAARMSGTRAECRRLAAELRSLRARTGLTMAGLAAASTHSKSSWSGI
ncbi:helix-turn-helix domain-containing protein [Streptacidiphilus sp. 4-A2]|nr:helix-turn-helix domain-containing protein [Streptacidiphilus sp. 4-A2]